MSAGRSRISTSVRNALHMIGVTIGCAVVVLLCPAVADAQCSANDFCVNYDTTTSADSGSTSASSLSWSHSMADGIHRAIVVGVSIRLQGSGTIPTVDSINYGGNDLVRLASAITADGSKGAEVWGLTGDGTDGVLTGSNTVEVELTSSAYFIGGAVTFTGVDPDTGFDATTERGASGTLAGASFLQSGTTSVIVGLGTINADNTVDSQYFTDQTERWDETTATGSSHARGFGSTRPGQGTFSTDIVWNLTSSTYWVVAAAEVLPFEDTVIRLASFNAESHGNRGVALRWRTGGERGTLGFRLYREHADGEFVPVNREIVAGSAMTSRATLEAGYSYAWSDPAGKAGDRYWLEEIEMSGARHRHGPFIAQAADVPSDTGPRSVTLNRVAVPSRTSVPIAVPGFALASKPAAEGDLSQQFALAADGSAMKIGVRDRGWYRVSRSDLIAAGFSPGGAADNLQLFTSGVQVPIRVSRAGDGHSGLFEAIEFYGVGVDETSTDTRVYWLAYGNEPGSRIVTDTSGVVGDEIATVPYTQELKERLVYVASFANGDVNNFYGAVLIGDPVERTLYASAYDSAAASPGALELVMRGFSDGPHEVRVELNDVYLTTLNGVNQDEMQAVVPIPAGALQEGANLLRLTPGEGVDISLIDTIRMQYPKRSVAEKDQLLITVPDALGSLTIDGFSQRWVRVFDVGDPFNVVDLTVPLVHSDGARRKHATVESGGDSGSDGTTYNARFALPPGTQRTIHAIGLDQVKRPAWIQANTPSSWHATSNGADVVMVTARQLIPALQPLVDYRTAQGYSVSVIPVDDLYDEYGFGLKRASAIRDLVVDAVGQWQKTPAYLILVGDANYDPRNFLGHGAVDLVPTKFIETNRFEAASDDWFGDIDENGTAELIVGRLPVKTVSELERLVSKTVAYEQAGVEWSEAMYVSDEDIGQQFEGSNGRFKGLLPSLTADDVIVRELGDTAARTAVLDGLDRGVSLISYVGHGSIETWSGGVLAVDMVDQISTDSSPAVFTMMNCMNGYFFDAALDSLAEALLTIDAGAVAVFAPTGITAHAPQEPMMAALYEALEAGTPGMTLGQAVAAAKLDAGSEDVRRTWVILGDPMITVR